MIPFEGHTFPKASAGVGDDWMSELKQTNPSSDQKEFCLTRQIKAYFSRALSSAEIPRARPATPGIDYSYQISTPYHAGSAPTHVLQFKSRSWDHVHQWRRMCSRAYD
ncbi:unnamed protein product [Aspergillus oryzae]|nr:unnamed protein product [Aspergillus oryzae]